MAVRLENNTRFVSYIIYYSLHASRPLTSDRKEKSKGMMSNNSSTAVTHSNFHLQPINSEIKIWLGTSYVIHTIVPRYLPAYIGNRLNFLHRLLLSAYQQIMYGPYLTYPIFFICLSKNFSISAAQKYI